MTAPQKQSLLCRLLGHLWGAMGSGRGERLMLYRCRRCGAVQAW